MPPKDDTVAVANGDEADPLLKKKGDYGAVETLNPEYVLLKVLLCSSHRRHWNPLSHS